MDGGASGGAAVSGGGPAPFLLKTYEMVDDSTTDAIVSWSGSMKSFVVWNPPEFQRVLLPSYFKHNNFSSFIRQLNTYGFRKIDPEKWEFANEEFIKDQKHLLKNIHRRKPIHSHSQPQSSIDPERAAFEDEIDKLMREKTELEKNILGYKQQQSAAKGQLGNLTDRIGCMEQRQKDLRSILEKAVQNPEFVERLAQKLESIDFSAYNKKRRLSALDNSQSVQEKVQLENQSISRAESGNIFQQNFGNNLRLQLSPAISDMNLPSHSTQSSNEDRISPQGRNEGWSNDVQVRTGSFLSPSDMVELSDTGASFTLSIDSSVSLKTGPESQKIQTLASDNDRDGHISCILDLTLASSSLELEKSQGIQTDQRPNTNSDGCNKKKVAVTGQNRVNDVFWEQFLTDNDEATSSGFKKNHYGQQEERESTKGISKNTEVLEHLTL